MFAPGTFVRVTAEAMDTKGRIGYVTDERVSGNYVSVDLIGGNTLPPLPDLYLTSELEMADMSDERDAILADLPHTD